MEPRPLNKPQRTAAPAPASSSPPTDRSGWAPPSSTSPGYTQPIPPVSPPIYGGFPIDQTSARGAWFDPAASSPPLPQPGEHGYSPGPPLTPIDSGPLGKILGPVLALLLLAAVVAAVVFGVLKILDGGDGRDTNAGLPPGSAVSAAQVTTTAAEAGGPTETSSGNADQTAVPTTEGGSAATTEEPKPTKTKKPEPTEEPASALSLLPTTGDFPDGFERTENDKRTEDAVASSFADPAEATEKLEEWGWEENAYRTFEIPADKEPDPNATTFINISIHYFTEKTGSRKALSYFADSVIEAQGLEEITVDKIGQETRALKGSPDGTNLVVLYIRYGNYLIRIGGSSPQGDPTQDVIDLANKIVQH